MPLPSYVFRKKKKLIDPYGQLPQQAYSKISRAKTFKKKEEKIKNKSGLKGKTNPFRVEAGPRRHDRGGCWLCLPGCGVSRGGLRIKVQPRGGHPTRARSRTLRAALSSEWLGLAYAGYTPCLPAARGCPRDVSDERRATRAALTICRPGRGGAGLGSHGRPEIRGVAERRVFCPTTPPRGAASSGAPHSKLP